MLKDWHEAAALLGTGICTGARAEHVELCPHCDHEAGIFCERGIVLNGVFLEAVGDTTPWLDEVGAALKGGTIPYTNMKIRESIKSVVNRTN